MGFCLINNVGVAAAALAGAGERVMIVDWDVHHGNGTEALFWDDDRVCYVVDAPGSLLSRHRRGRRHRRHERARADREHAAPGAARPATSSARALDEVVAPVADRFAPTWVLVSAGFDAHRDDPLADLALSSGDFAHLAAIVRGFAPRSGRLAIFLEGGYDLDAVRAVGDGDARVGARRRAIGRSAHERRPRC